MTKSELCRQLRKEIEHFSGLREKMRFEIAQRLDSGDFSKKRFLKSNLFFKIREELGRMYVPPKIWVEYNDLADTPSDTWYSINTARLDQLKNLVEKYQREKVFYFLLKDNE